MNKPKNAEQAQIWATLILILAQIQLLVWPTYCEEWWHLGGLLLFA